MLFGSRTDKLCRVGSRSTFPPGLRASEEQNDKLTRHQRWHAWDKDQEQRRPAQQDEGRRGDGECAARRLWG